MPVSSLKRKDAPAPAATRRIPGYIPPPDIAGATARPSSAAAPTATVPARWLSKFFKAADLEVIDQWLTEVESKHNLVGIHTVYVSGGVLVLARVR